jgi:flagellar motor switch protein FliN
MTETTQSGLPDSSGYIQAWAESLAQVLGQISGAALPCTVLADAPPDPVPIGENDLWVVGACSGGIRGEMSLRLTPPTLLRLAQIFVSEPVAPEAELTPDHREAAMELLRQIAGVVVTALKPRWGEVQVRLDASPSAPSWPASSTVWLRIGDEANPQTLIELQVSAALAAALRAEKPDGAKPAPSASPALLPEAGQVRLDLLLDVGLAVTLRFGSRQLLLREVLDLHPGAVVDLDRQVKDPVDVLLDGRLLARGEVVVLDGNYGLRITEVAPPGPV